MDGGNILRPEILAEIDLLNNFIMNNITVPTYDGKFNLTYQDLCLSYDWVCGANEHIRMFREMSKVGRVIDLSFPKGGNKVIQSGNEPTNGNATGHSGISRHRVG